MYMLINNLVGDIKNTTVYLCATNYLIDDINTNFVFICCRYILSWILNDIELILI